MKPTVVPIGDLPSADYQGEAASLDGNPVGVFVSPERDLVAKPGANGDSWFVISRLETSRGRIDLLVHINAAFPTSGVVGKTAVMASMLDASNGRYSSEEQDVPTDQCTFATDKCEVITPIATIRGDAAGLNIAGTWSKAGIACDITIVQAGPMLANAGVGLFPWFGGLTYHFALPTMTTTGTITIGGETLEVSGNSWLDRQWATAPRLLLDRPLTWAWFGLLFDDGTRISCWDIMEEDRRHRFATILSPTGGHEVVTVEPTLERSSKRWTSPATGRVYPTRWELHLPQIDGSLIVEADVPGQEFVSPVGAHRYEAAAAVTGTLRGRQLNGYGTIELRGVWT